MKSKILLCCIMGLLLLTSCTNNATSRTSPDSEQQPDTSTANSLAPLVYDGVALVFPDTISISDCYSGSVTVVSAKDDHTLLYNYETEQTEVALSADQVENLNVLYQSITDYSNEIEYSSTSVVTFTHFGRMDSFTLGCANQAELNYYVEVIGDLQAQTDMNPVDIVWEVPSNTDISFFDKMIVETPLKTITVTKVDPCSMQFDCQGKTQVVKLKKNLQIYEMNKLFRDISSFKDDPKSTSDTTITIYYDNQVYVLDDECLFDNNLDMYISEVMWQYDGMQ